MVDVPTPTERIVNVAVVAPIGTVIVAGTVATPVLLLDKDTTAPPEPAACVSVIVPTEICGYGIVDGDALTLDTSGEDATERIAVLVATTVPLIVELPVWFNDVTVKFAVVLPCATVTLAGTVATEVLLLDNVTTVPPEGAADVSVTVPVDVVGYVTLVGDKLKAEISG